METGPDRCFPMVQGKSWASHGIPLGRTRLQPRVSRRVSMNPTPKPSPCGPSVTSTAFRNASAPGRDRRDVAAWVRNGPDGETSPCWPPPRPHASPGPPLPQCPDPPLSGEGRPGAPTGRASPPGSHRRDASRRRPPSSLHPPSRVSSGRRCAPAALTSAVPGITARASSRLPPAGSIRQVGAEHAAPAPCWCARRRELHRQPSAGPP